MKHYRTFITFLQRNRLFAAVNLAGLSLSLMFVLLIADMVSRQLTVDSGTRAVERTYLFASRDVIGAHYALGDLAQERYPEIEEWCATCNDGGVGDEYADIDGQKFDVKVLLARDNFFEFFGFPLLEGDPATVLKDDYGVVLTESAARRLFGNKEAVGRTLKMNFDDSHSYTVTGVMADIGNSLFPSETEMIIPYAAMKYINFAGAMENTGMMNFGSANLFIHVPEGVNPNAKQKDLEAWMNELLWFFRSDLFADPYWIPMRDVYFSETGSPGLNQYDWKLLLVFIATGVLILLMAVLNYVSMSVAQTSYRAKEMATRRLLGSSAGSIFRHMLAESLAMTLAAFLIAFLLAVAAEPLAMKLLNTRLDLIGDLSPLTVTAYAAFILLLSAAAGFLPATLLSRSNPMDVVHGTFRRKTRTVYLRVLSIVQSGVTVALLTCSLSLSVTIYRMLHEPLGYTYGNVLCYPNMGETEALRHFRDETRRLPFVKAVSLTRGMPVDGGNNFTSLHNVNGKEKNIGFQIFETDSAFLSIFHIPIEQDLHVSAPNAYFLNHQAFKELSLPETTTTFTTVDGRGTRQVAGRIPDFRLRDVTYPMYPVLLQVLPDDSITRPWDVLVEVHDGDLNAWKRELDAMYAKAVDNVPFESHWYDELIGKQYDKIMRMDKVVLAFTGAALLISLLGLMAMSVYHIEQRKRDMAIRKVFGSDSRREMRRMLRFSSTSLLAGLIVATPLAIVGEMQLAKQIAYETPYPWWVPPVAFAFVAAASLLSVWAITRRTVSEAPVKHLKKE